MFEAGPDRYLFEASLAYYARYRAVIPVPSLRTALQRLEADEAVTVATRYTSLAAAPVPDDQFQWAVEATYEEHRDLRALEALRVSALAISGQAAVEGERVIRGYEDAQAHLLQTFAALDRLSNTHTPEITLRDAHQTIMAGVGESLRASSRVPLGLPEIDEATSGGLAPGELWLIAGYAGQGKTTFAVSVVTYRALLAGLNVLYVSGETLTDTILRRLTVRHSRDSRFGMPGGVPSSSVRAGMLSAEQYAAYQSASIDLTSNADYGQLAVVQMPMRATFDSVEDLLKRYEREFHHQEPHRAGVHVLVVDSIDMVKAVRPAASRMGYSIQMNERGLIGASIEDFAQLAINHDGGRGLAVVSPYQIKREAYEEAIAREGTARYTLSCLADTSTAERRSSVVVSLLRVPSSPGQLRAQILKNRDGPTSEFILELDDATCFIAPSGANLGLATAGVSGLF